MKHGPHKLKTLVPGERFGRLVVIKQIGSTPAGKRKYLCRCDCGQAAPVVGAKLQRGHTRSCGCLHREQLAKRSTTHGGCTSPMYRCWLSMRERCTNPNRKDWKYYGGRGIKVSPAWNDFSKFLDDMGPRPAGKTIDRIDPNGNYEAGNCRWATWLEQRHNRRDSKCS